jgi:DNA polymerase III gamma/tau subunit
LNELAQYLLDNIIVDFEGEVTTETVRELLRKDDSQAARALLQRIIEDNGIEDLLLAVADCLNDNLANGINTGVIREHLVGYSDS